MSRYKIAQLTLFVLTVTLFASCGYRPVAQEVKKSLAGSISSEIVISMRDPENSVLVKDALDEAIIKRFRTQLVTKNESKRHLKIYINSVDIRAITYDVNGFISRYQIKVTISVDMSQKVSHKEIKSKVFDAIGYYIFETDLISDSERFKAIEKASEKALDSFINQVIIEEQ